MQQVRKRASLVPTDDVKMEHLVLSEPENLGIEKVLTNHCRIFEKALRRPSDKDLVITFDGKIPDGNMEGMIIQE
jgi:isoleucyl-tRNA synthetase